MGLVMEAWWRGFDFGSNLVLISMMLLEWCGFDFAGICLVPILVILLDWCGSNFAGFCWSFVDYFILFYIFIINIFLAVVGDGQ